jgi:hypothetical protein
LEFSKLKLEVYDLLGIILPGLLLVFECEVLANGWGQFISSANQISGKGLVLLILFAFAVGQFVQEIGDTVITFLMGKRYFRKALDKFWATPSSDVVKQTIKKEFAQDIESVDVAFDYCLTKIKTRFAKREIFVATSDLCRSFVVLSFLAAVPAGRIAFHDISPCHKSFEAFAGLLVLLFFVGALAWRRMVRFRELSEITVFHVYLGTKEPTRSAKSARHDSREN